MIEWIRGWWMTFRIWRESDAKTWAFLTGPFDPDDFIEAPRPI